MKSFLYFVLSLIAVFLLLLSIGYMVNYSQNNSQTITQNTLEQIIVKRPTIKEVDLYYSDGDSHINVDLTLSVSTDPKERYKVPFENIKSARTVIEQIQNQLDQKKIKYSVSRTHQVNGAIFLYFGFWYILLAHVVLLLWSLISLVRIEIEAKQKLIWVIILLFTPVPTVGPMLYLSFGRQKTNFPPL